MLICNKEVVVVGKFPRIGRLSAEYHEHIDSVSEFVKEAKERRLKADLLTFPQDITDTTPKYDFYLEWDSTAVLSITTYDHWWKSQINDKTRNMVRKAIKKGVDIRIVEFNDDLVKGIVNIYNESPLRQGKPFLHYGEDFETVRTGHISYLERSDFIGAFYDNELIGFIKLVHREGVSTIMQIISMNTHRNKAPTNGLIAKAVEVCAQKGTSFLHYGVWSKRGLGDFKRHHAFEKRDVPRYYVPLNLKGKLSLRLGLHHKISARLPENWIEFMADWRRKWNLYRYDTRTG